MNALHIVVAMKPVDCSNADNAIERGVCGLNIDGARIGTEGGTCRDGKADKPNDAGWENMRGHGVAELNAGRWPANIAHDGSPTVVKQFPYSNGCGTTGGGTHFIDSVERINPKQEKYGDEGSASRFFKECKT